MSYHTRQKTIEYPPFRPCPESTRRIMRTQLACLSLPAAAAIWIFGWPAFSLMSISAITAFVLQIIARKIKPEKLPGDITHSTMLGLIMALTLPANCPWYIAFIAVIATIVVGKQLLGGIGNYLWHPVLIGQVIIQLFFHRQLAGAASQIAGTFANIPSEALRRLAPLNIVDSVPQLGRYLTDHLPTLQQYILGYHAGPIGQACAPVLILVGIYFIYRGYLHWQLPLIFVSAAYIAAAILPVIAIEPNTSTPLFIVWPLVAENIESGFTYINYHLFSGGLLMGALILSADTTARPITIYGQMIFAVGAGILTMVFSLYSNIPIPCYAALLTMAIFTPALDRITRQSPAIKNYTQTD
jgi:Na+-translocating ferredoxin:NAD+ oxidoreductase subunit D